MNTPSEGTRILGIRRVGSYGFGTAVAVRVEHNGRVRTLTLGSDGPIEGFGRAGARAIRDAIEQYEATWSVLDLEGRVRLLWQEASDHLAHCAERTEAAILAAVPEVRRARETEPPQAADTSDLLGAIERERKADDERSALLDFIRLVLGNSVLHRWEREEENARFLAEHERALREQQDSRDQRRPGGTDRVSSNSKLSDTNLPSQRRND